MRMLLVLPIVLVFLVPAPICSTVADEMQIAKPGCPDTCGGIKIPYPFGIRDGCFYNVSDIYYGDQIYKITCDNSTDRPAPAYNGGISSIFGDRNIPVLNITLDDHSFRIEQGVAYHCYQNNATTSRNSSFLSTVFTVSTTKNMFVATGCDTEAFFKVNDLFYTGCISYCTSLEKIQNGTCSGVGCCETPVPHGTNIIRAYATSFYSHMHAHFNPCSLVFIVANDAFNFSVAFLTSSESHFHDLRVPMVLDWSIIDANKSCASADKLCGLNTKCANTTKGYQCKCLEGYRGNPYLSQGCRDVDECHDPNLNQCQELKYCVNKPGGYDCKCPKGLHGNGTKSDPCRARGWSSWSTGVKVTIGTGIGLIIFLIGGILLYLHHEKKKLLDLREKFFQENGGLILHQKLSGRDISVQKFKIFTAQELEKATACFSESNVVGRGGFGMVYKGALADGQQIAIKRSLKVDPNQVDQFINEILVLSEINNRHVVKLLGCCLETEVPSLVYEFINNGTLYEHLHDERKASLLSWDIRLSIAEAVASVLSYLHTTIAIPIIHRDMKSMNILLDESYTAKVSDFGASKLVPMDQDQLATVVLGTCGYLDPEYMQTNELTAKSDVYSFGVVLVELLTRKKACSYRMPEPERSLAVHFLHKMKEDRLLDIVDEAIVNDNNLEQLKEVAELGKQCLSLTGEERPAMKEVAMKLGAVRKMVRNPYNNVAALPEECQSLLADNNLEDYESTSSTTANIGSRSLLLDLDDGR